MSTLNLHPSGQPIEPHPKGCEGQPCALEQPEPSREDWLRYLACEIEVALEYGGTECVIPVEGADWLLAEIRRLRSIVNPPCHCGAQGVGQWDSHSPWECAFHLRQTIRRLATDAVRVSAIGGPDAAAT